jgi:hypothetical protein
MTHLAPALEAELKAVRSDPIEAIGYGKKTYRPYEPSAGENLIASDDPAVTSRLLAEAQGSGDRVYRLAVVHLLGMRATSDVDAALIALLDDREVGATAAYLLGRAGFKGYPSRTRDAAAIVAALRRHLDDAATFDDPFYRRTFRVRTSSSARWHGCSVPSGSRSPIRGSTTTSAMRCPGGATRCAPSF